MQYKIRRDYRATTYKGENLIFAKGEVVELDDETAAWIERDSPGLLTEVKPKEARAKAAPAKDRQVKEAVKR